MNDLRYPVGRFTPPAAISPGDRRGYIQHLVDAPERLRAAIEGLSDEQLSTPYRPEGWTVRQVVHHLPDSHLNAYVRFRLALTEDEPTIRTYREELWAELPDSRLAPVELSLSLLESLHRRLALMLRNVNEEEWRRPYRHPERSALIPLEVGVAEYAWHGRHHVAQITALRERMGWR
jgi:hypothetical protein